MIKTKIMQYLSDNDVVTHYQHGFVAKRNPVLQIYLKDLKSGQIL